MDPRTFYPKSISLVRRDDVGSAEKADIKRALLAQVSTGFSSVRNAAKIGQSIFDRSVPIPDMRIDRVEAKGSLWDIWSSTGRF